jgi:hypothetical protein
MVERFALVLGVIAAVAMAPAVATASPYAPGAGPDNVGPPVPLNGQYVMNTALDRQTFNGSPDPATPFASAVTFTTSCTATVCVAHSSMSARDMPFDFRWTGTQWQSAQRIQWTCEGKPTPATMTITLTPKRNGTLSGERSAVIDAPGCGSPRVPGKVVAPLSAVPA